MNFRRREFLEKLFLITGSVAVVGCSETSKSTPQITDEPPNNPKPLKTSPPPVKEENPLLKGLNLDNFVLHNSKPLALESIRTGIGMGALTATNRLFIRNNLPSPDASIVENPEQWVLNISGVHSPKSFTLADLKKFAYENICAVLQCSGNGRAFFKHGPSGSQWATGAAGCVIWGGTKLKDLIEDSGNVMSGMNYITATGGEELPKDVSQENKVERSIPLKKGLKDCIVAWEMNGEPIPISHGGPIRFVVPGYFGCNQIKYVKHIAVTKEQSTAKIQDKGYRLRDIGEKGNNSQPSMWRMPVKSWIVSSTQVTDKTHRMNGVAFSGERGVKKIEYSLDGQKWHSASFYGPDLGIHAWRVFQIEAEVPDNIETVFTRATDNNGDIQPRNRMENERGYGNNSWLDHGFNLRGATDTEQSTVAVVEIDDETAAAGKKVFQETSPTCGTCHTLSDAGTTGQIGPNLDQLKPNMERVERAVTNGVGAMPSFGEALTEEQIKNLAKYVTHATQK